MKEAIKKFMIEKAKQIFEKKGFKNTTIEDIAKASSISIPTFYNYFPGKEDVFLEVIKSIDTQLDEDVFPIFNSDIDFFVKLEKLFYKLIEFVKENKEIVRIAFFDSKVHLNFIKCKENYVLKNKEKRIAAMVAFFEMGKKDGIVNKDLNSEFISLFIMGIIHEVFFKIIFKKEDINAKDFVSDILVVFKNGIKK